MYAILGVYNEADVIAETVRSLFDQGCDRVFLVDNASDDGTRDIACDAGAELQGEFSLPIYSEHARIALMNAVVGAVSTSEDHEYIWWLWADGDELTTSASGGSVRMYLENLDARIRIVGTHYVEHWPNPRVDVSDAISVFDLAPLATLSSGGPCVRAHRKHPLQKYERGSPPIVCESGFHKARCSELLYEDPASPLITHHFPFREYHRTLERLRNLTNVGRLSAHEEVELRRESNISRRARLLEDVYAGRWSTVGLESPPEQWQLVVDRIAQQAR